MWLGYAVTAMVENPPRRVLDQARKAHLGAPLRVFDARPRAAGWVALLVLAAALLVLGGLAYRASGRTVPAFIALALAAAYLAGALVIFWRAVVRGRVVHLFENGFTVAAGRTPEVFTWDELISVSMTGLRNTRRGSTRWRFTAVAGDGREVEFGGELPRLGEFGGVVTQEVTVRVVPWYLRAVEAGGTVSFGPYLVGRDGIAKDGDLVAWPQVQDVVLDNGMVMVWRAGQVVLAATVGAVPNAVAFAALCQELQVRGAVDR